MLFPILLSFQPVASVSSTRMASEGEEPAFSRLLSEPGEVSCRFLSYAML